MKKSKKILTTALAAVMLLSGTVVLTGCGSGGSKTQADEYVYVPEYVKITGADGLGIGTVRYANKQFYFSTYGNSGGSGGGVIMYDNGATQKIAASATSVATPADEAADSGAAIYVLGLDGAAKKLDCYKPSAIPDGKSVYILGRYSFDIDSVINDSVRKIEKGTDVFIDFNGKEFKFLTIHEAKGLEADYIILLNCNSGLYGFPSAISDDPVLDLVLSEQDHFEFGEERRLFYVAMTRAKEKSIVLYDSHSPSVFVTEFQNSFSSSSADLCPICGVGHKKVLRTGTASNGIPYTIYVCSNSQSGCPFFERVFDN